MIGRYFLVGGTAALVDWVLFALGTQAAGLPWFPVALFSFLAATGVNYLLSIRYVFHSGVRYSMQHELALVLLASAFGLLLNQAILWFLIERAHWNMMLGKIQATGMVFLWNYSARRYHIFRKRS
jgi:putative flippase GtrA